MNVYVMNDEVVNALYERIQLSVKEATEEWKTDFRNRTFIHNVVVMGIPGELSKEMVTKLVEICLWASLEREEGAFSPFSVAVEPPNPDEFNSHYKFEKDIDLTPTNQIASYIGGYKYRTLVDKYEVVGEFESNLRSGSSQPERERVMSKLILALERGKKSLEDIYNLTKVDGATILSQNLRVLGFGAKIVSQSEVETISITEPFEDSSSDVIEFAKWNVGMRHKSAAKFVYEQRDCLAVVVSEDRRMSVFSWDEERDTVQQLKNFELMILG